jgi:E3 ubiquitin-protein ligase UBR4
MHWLLELFVDRRVMSNATLKELLTALVPNLALGSDECMDALISSFMPYLDWNRYDMDTANRAETTVRLDTFCAMSRAVQVSTAGSKLKDKLLSANLVKHAAEYLGMHHPPLFKTSVDSAEWKEFLARPALKYVLRVLAGLAHGHAPSQLAVAADCIPIMHRLEQISTGTIMVFRVN